MKKTNLFRLAVSVALPLLAGFLGSIFTAPATQSWYLEISKPSWNPPSWLFAPVWTALYILMGVALYLVWQKQAKNKGAAMVLFAVQLILNALWSFIFFGLGNFWLAWGEILVLWSFILATIISFRKINKTAGWLLLPYILWVSFASFLNFTVASLN